MGEEGHGVRALLREDRVGLGVVDELEELLGERGLEEGFLPNQR